MKFTTKDIAYVYTKVKEAIKAGQAKGGMELDNLGMDSPIMVIVLILLICMGYVLVGGALFTVPKQNTYGIPVNIISPIPQAPKNTLQMQTFGGSTVVPTPSSEPSPTPNLGNPVTPVPTI